MRDQVAVDQFAPIMIYYINEMIDNEKFPYFDAVIILPFLRITDTIFVPKI